MKYLFLIADGMGDWPLDELNARTPLQAADTPHMDALAKQGVVGTCRTVPAGMPPGSDVANMALLGFNPANHHTGRGPIEAAAQGLELADNDLVWRCNLVTVSELSVNGFMRDYSAGHITTERAIPILRGLQMRFGSPRFTFHPGVQYRHLLVQKGAADSDEAGIHVQPPHDITDKSIAASMESYKANPPLHELIMRASHWLAENSDNDTKANAIWPWGQGRPLRLPSFEKVYGLRGAVISAVDLIKGLGRAAGMEVLDVPGATGLLDTNYAGKVRAALDFLSHGDFVFVHLEGPDECGHGGDIDCKVEAINRFDRLIVGPLREALASEPAAFLVTCDHLTPIALKTHHADPVPFLLNWPGCSEPSGVGEFNELSAAQGVRVSKGHELLPWVLEKTGRGA